MDAPFDLVHLTLALTTALFAALAAAFAVWWRGAEGERRRARENWAAAAARAEAGQAAAAKLEETRARAEALAADLARLEADSAARARAFAEKEAALSALRADVEERFQALAADALRRSQASFLEVANETLSKQREGAESSLNALLKPVHESFAQFRDKVEAIQTAQAEDRAGLSEQMQGVAAAMRETREVTGRLVTALRASPKTRGRWGEEQLRNILELSGLSAFTDFDEQASVAAEDRLLRPDVIVRLPGDRCIVIDSKVALDAYLEAVDAPDDAGRELLLKRHAEQMRTHVKQLAGKAYQEHVPASADFVAMFVPGENFFAAAAERDPELFQDAMARKVVIVTPATLFALAKAVAFGWRQAEAERNARAIAALGKELYKRLADMAEGLEGLGRKLDGAVKGYNALVGTVEGRVLPQARRFRDLEAGDPERAIAEVEVLEAAPRALKAGELAAPAAGAPDDPPPPEPVS